MRLATIAAISLLLIALAGCAHAGDEPETAEICRNTEEWGELNKTQKSMLKTICAMMPLAQEIEKEKIHELTGCAEYPLKESWLRKIARIVITTPGISPAIKNKIETRIVIATQTCRLAREIRDLSHRPNLLSVPAARLISELKDELRRLKRK